MTDLSTLRSLQQRIREATGPDRELDADISCALLGGMPDLAAPRIDPEYRRRRVGGAYFDVPNFTRDPDGLGACKALMLEVLPGCVWERTKNGSIHVYRAAGALLPIGFPEIGEICANDCLTFIDAICAARIAELEAEQEKERVG